MTPDQMLELVIAAIVVAVAIRILADILNNR